jgi:hypothetical protein
LRLRQLANTPFPVDGPTLTSAQAEAIAIVTADPLTAQEYEYLRTCIGVAPFLWIGIIGIELAPPASRYRVANWRPRSGFASLLDRIDTVEKALIRAGAHRSRFRVLPFPAEYPALAGDYLPPKAPILLQYQTLTAFHLGQLTAHGYTLKELA